MHAAAKLLRERSDDYARLVADEMGKPLAQGKGEIEKCAALCDFYADHSGDFLEGRTIKTDMKKSFVVHEPLGVVFGIMPWNFPFWQVFRFAVPALMAGNGALLKHAPISTGTAFAIEKLFADAGFPANIFRTAVIANDTAAQVIAYPHTAAVTFTGSVNAGKTIAAEAGKALKKTVLELGGCDAYLILQDADLELAANTLVTSRMNNAGQSCIAAKRLIAVAEVQEAFVKLLQEKLQQFVLGDPLDARTTCGPLARKDIRDHVHEQVQKSVALGAKLLLGGSIPDRPGFYYARI
jgi:succinate-semialdehyde dehydrogenase / glutarate-semialdehyde dehydrogenase